MDCNTCQVPKTCTGCQKHILVECTTCNTVTPQGRKRVCTCYKIPTKKQQFEDRPEVESFPKSKKTTTIQRSRSATISRRSPFRSRSRSRSSSRSFSMSSDRRTRGNKFRNHCDDDDDCSGFMDNKMGKHRHTFNEGNKMGGRCHVYKGGCGGGKCRDHSDCYQHDDGVHGYKHKYRHHRHHRYTCQSKRDKYKHRHRREKGRYRDGDETDEYSRRGGHRHNYVTDDDDDSKGHRPHRGFKERRSFDEEKERRRRRRRRQKKRDDDDDDNDDDDRRSFISADSVDDGKKRRKKMDRRSRDDEKSFRSFKDDVDERLRRKKRDRKDRESFTDPEQFNDDALTPPYSEILDNPPKKKEPFFKRLFSRFGKKKNKE